MNNSIIGRNSYEVTIQLERAEVQKKSIIKKIYKEYDIYFQIVRKSIIKAVEKGILGLYHNLSIDREKELNTKEFYEFLNKNISLFIHSKLPFITIEQLKLGDISDPQKYLVNVNALKEFVKANTSQIVDFDYDDESFIKEKLEFNCNKTLDTYEFYETLSEEEYSSINLDENDYLDFFKQKSIKKIEHTKDIVDSVIDFLEGENDDKLNNVEIINDQLGDLLISGNNLNSFEFIDNSFNNFLLSLSYRINSELFEMKLIKKKISEDTFKFLSNKNYIIKHPSPFIIKYNLFSNQSSLNNNETSDIFLFNISNVELEFYNVDLSVSRNKINRLKSKLRLLNKKKKYWENKAILFNSQN